MKLREEFEVAKSVASVWSFFEQTEQVAKCVPGVEDVTVHGPDDIEARLTQSVGPMTATFAGSVRIVERVPQKRLSFTATGKSVRGASGNVRANVEVSLEERADRAAVVVEAELALAGPLGSVGQKVVAKQAGKVTAAFSRNLEQALGGTAAATPDEVGSEEIDSEKTESGTSPGAEPAGRADTHAAVAAAQRWGKVAAACSTASLVVSLVSLWRNLRAGAQ